MGLRSTVLSAGSPLCGRDARKTHANQLVRGVPILSLSDVGKRYPLGESYVDALNGVTLDIDEGEFLAFAGPSGSGKTTLLNLVGCLDVATSGSIVLDGKELSKLSRAELGDIRADNVGFVFQSFNLIPVLSAIENVEVALRLGGREPSRETSWPRQELECSKRETCCTMLGGKYRCSRARHERGSTAVVGG